MADLPSDIWDKAFHPSEVYSNVSAGCSVLRCAENAGEVSCGERQVHAVEPLQTVQQCISIMHKVGANTITFRADTPVHLWPSDGGEVVNTTGICVTAVCGDEVTWTTAEAADTGADEMGAAVVYSSVYAGCLA